MIRDPFPTRIHLPNEKEQQDFFCFISGAFGKTVIL